MILRSQDPKEATVTYNEWISEMVDIQNDLLREKSVINGIVRWYHAKNNTEDCMYLMSFYDFNM